MMMHSGPCKLRRVERPASAATATVSRLSPVVARRRCVVVRADAAPTASTPDKRTDSDKLSDLRTSVAALSAVAAAVPAAADSAPGCGKPAPPPPVPAPSEAEQLAGLRNQILAARSAQEKYATYTQKQVDAIFKAAAAAASAARLPLACMAVEETGMGLMEDKVIKNHFASEFVYNKYKDFKSVGVVEEEPASGIQKIAEPVGLIAGIVPTTNPTSTAIFKSLLALKTRNALILSPHMRAAKSTIAAARIVRDAAEAAGAPKGLITWVDSPSPQLAAALMKDPGVNLILATGGPAMVRASYESGHPSIGVGAGNTPTVIDDSADVQMAVNSILLSKTFDNGVICASEQSVIVQDSVYDKVVAEFVKRGAYFMTKEQTQAAGKVILKDGRLNADVVGQAATKLAAMFGFSVPDNTRVLIGEVADIGRSEPMSYEKLCPVLGMYRASSFEDAVNKAAELVAFGGSGHTSVLYTRQNNHERIAAFNSRMKTVRILVNCPASQGAIGDVFNFHLDPSLTLGCGTWGSTSVSANVGPQHLLNYKTTVTRQENMLWFRVPPKIYFKPGCLEVALKELKGCQRAFIVTDQPLFAMGVTHAITDVLDPIGVHYKCFTDVEPDPTLATIERGLRDLRSFKPDAIIAVGGGSPMDAAKLMWLLYEYPDIKFDDVAARFMDIRKRINDVKPLGSLAQFVAIPTTSGTGSEVTPFAVVTDQKTGIKYPIADYALTPTMAIVDSNLVLGMPKSLTAFGGIDALTHALESYVSVFATDYTMGLSKEAVKLLFKYLPDAYTRGADDPFAREKVHYAATIAGMAFANAMLGVCHSMAHKLGSAFHVPHGLANAALISHVIRYNATDAPYKQACFPQYPTPIALRRYAELSDMLGLGGTTQEDKTIKLIEAVEELKHKVEIKPCLRDIIGADREAEYKREVHTMAYQAFDDQCTGANPRYPLVRDLRQMLLDAYDAPILPLTNLDFKSPAN